MPNYRYEFFEGEEKPETVVDLPNDRAAAEQALLTARETMADSILDGVDPRDWITKVYDEAGNLVATVTFADVVGGIDEGLADVDEPGVTRSG